ncbi:MAG: hypothetical protein ACRD8Z_15175, partial [Nitrososphaeraceae archaeon]
TALGNVVYEAVSLLGKALNYYWVLKAVESFQAPSALKKEVISILMDSLIDDRAIKKIVMHPPIAS